MRRSVIFPAILSVGVGLVAACDPPKPDVPNKPPVATPTPVAAASPTPTAAPVTSPTATPSKPAEVKKVDGKDAKPTTTTTPQTK